jgi:hypothetical protein
VAPRGPPRRGTDPDPRQDHLRHRMVTDEHRAQAAPTRGSRVSGLRAAGADGRLVPPPRSPPGPGMALHARRGPARSRAGHRRVGPKTLS